MVSFWTENQLVQTKKKQLIEGLIVWRTKVYAKVQGYSFLKFFGFSKFVLLPLLFKFYENGRHIYGLKTSLKAQQLFHFLINFRINMADYVDPCKVVVRKSEFSALSNPCAQNESENRKF
jgi:hypothetical protein